MGSSRVNTFFTWKFGTDRRAECAAVGKKPAVAIGHDFSVYVGNPSDAEITLTAGELFGFGRGAFEQKVVSLVLGLNLITSYEFSFFGFDWLTAAASGDVGNEIHGLPFRFADDLTYVSYQREMFPLCQLLRKLAIDQGISAVEIADHVLKPRMAEDSWGCGSCVLHVLNQNLESSCLGSSFIHFHIALERCCSIYIYIHIFK